MTQLSLRLKTIADFVDKGAKVCDVGTDHGYLAIYLKSNGIAESVIATDLNEKPLERARKNIAFSGTKGIELRCCDGLEDLKPEEADTVIIAGMGGEVISGILERGSLVSKNSKLKFITQPTTSPEILRKYLCNNGFEIQNEVAVEENSKVYSVMLFRYIGEPKIKDEAFYYIGLVKPDSKSGIKYIEKQKKRVYDCLCALQKNGKNDDRYNGYKKAFDGINEIVLKYGE